MALLMLSACNERLEPQPEAEDPDLYTYYIALSVTDPYGYDMVAPLGYDRWKPFGDNTEWRGEINPLLYSLDILLSSPEDKWIHRTSNASGVYPYFQMVNSDGESRYWLFNEVTTLREDGLQSTITYRFSSTMMMVDGDKHDLVTYWTVDQNSKDKVLYPECTKALLDDRQVNVSKQVFHHTDVRDYYVYLIEIILDL